MNTIKIYQLHSLSPAQFRRLRNAQMEAAQVWNLCMQTHKPARMAHTKWPGRVILPMGRGRASLVLPVELPENSRSVSLVWNKGFELHVCVETPQAQHVPGTNHAAVDLGEIHLAAVTTNTGKALTVTGRGIR